MFSKGDPRSCTCYLNFFNLKQFSKCFTSNSCFVSLLSNNFHCFLFYGKRSKIIALSSTVFILSAISMLFGSSERADICLVVTREFWEWIVYRAPRSRVDDGWFNSHDNCEAMIRHRERELLDSRAIKVQVTSRYAQATKTNATRGNNPPALIFDQVSSGSRECKTFRERTLPRPESSEIDEALYAYITRVHMTDVYLTLNNIRVIYVCHVSMVLFLSGLFFHGRVIVVMPEIKMDGSKTCFLISNELGRKHFPLYCGETAVSLSHIRCGSNQKTSLSWPIIRCNEICFAFRKISHEYAVKVKRFIFIEYIS